MISQDFEKDKGVEMKRPKLRYAYNEALINTYAEELEKYCE